MFKSKPKATTLDPIAQMRADIAMANGTLLAAEQELGDAVLESAGKPDDATAGHRCKAANAALEAAQRNLDTLKHRLAAVEKTGAARAATAAARAAERDLAARWAKAEDKGKERVRAAKALEAAGAAMAQAWRDLKRATDEIVETRLAYDTSGAMLNAGELEMVMRHGLAKAACAAYRDGPADGPFYPFWWMVKGTQRDLLEQLPALSARLEAANAHLLSQKVRP